MYSVQQWPQPPFRDIGLLHLRKNGLEAVHHYLLTRLHLVIFLFTIIPPWCNYLPINNIRLRVANENNRKHVNILWIESTKGSNLCLLFLTSRLTNVSHRGLSRAFL